MGYTLELTCLAAQACPMARAQKAPAIALYQDSVFLAWPGLSGQIFYSWKSIRTANTGFNVSGSPAVAVLDATLYMVWRGAGDGSQHLYYATFDGQGWSKSEQCNTQYSASQSPSLVAPLHGGLCMAWCGATDSNIYLADFNGKTWSSQSKYSCHCDSSPSLATSGSSLYLAWQDNAAAKVAWGGATASAAFYPYPSVYEGIISISGGPQLVYLDRLYLIFRGADENDFSSKAFYAMRYYDEDWSSPGVLNVATTAGGCSVFPYFDETFGYSALLAWRDARDGESLYFCRVAPYPFSGWMGKYSAQLANMTLSQMCLPGAHDAGMSRIDSCVRGGSVCTTQTQSYAILWQLLAGVRYFDIRPVWNAEGEIVCGHFDTFGVVMGCYGESISDVLFEINMFMERFQGELIILKFSHYSIMGTIGSKPPIGDLVNQVATALQDSLFVNTTGKRLADIDFATLTGTKGAVLVVFDGKIPSKPAGIYTYADYNPKKPSFAADLVVYDVYSKTDELSKMTSDQCAKLANPANHNADMFLLSWTLTMDEGSYLSGWCIRDLALQANDALESFVSNEFGTSYSPNIIYVDYANGWCAEFCLYVMGWADLSFIKRYKNSL